MSQQGLQGAWTVEDGRGVAWMGPDHRWYLICATREGYAFYSPQEVEPEGEAELEADLDGNVSWRGEPLGWKVSRSALALARQRSS